MSNCKELWIARRIHQHLQTAGKGTGWGTTEREREIYGQKEREKGMQCYMKKEDNSLIDVEHVETTGERCHQLS